MEQRLGWVSTTGQDCTGIFSHYNYKSIVISGNVKQILDWLPAYIEEDTPSFAWTEKNATQTHQYGLNMEINTLLKWAWHFSWLSHCELNYILQGIKSSVNCRLSTWRKHIWDCHVYQPPFSLRRLHLIYSKLLQINFICYGAVEAFAHTARAVELIGKFHYLHHWPRQTGFQEDDITGDGKISRNWEWPSCGRLEQIQRKSNEIKKTPAKWDTDLTEYKF